MSATVGFGTPLTEGMVIGDHFVIRRKLGGGGMGEVFLAENQNVPDKRYAIKVLRSEFSAQPRFVAILQDEASKQARLDHDNVVGMYDYFRWGSHYCLVQDFIDGKTLADRIAEAPAGLDLQTALGLMGGILSGLDYAHEIGILHCDVKPANVIIGLDKRPRVTDFGISREIGREAPETGLGGAGTAEYMSPEQILPPYAFDHRCDVFSAGVLFFEMLTGRLPYRIDTTQAELIWPQLMAEAPDVREFRRDIPEAIARIVATALRRDPGQRFQGCADFRRALEDFSRRERWRKTWLPAIAIAGTVLAAGAFGLYQWRQSVAERARIEHEEVIARTRKVVEDALVNASSSLRLLCREAAEYGIRRKGVDNARDSGLVELAQKFEVRLKEMDENMTKQAMGYEASLRQLNRVEKALVADGIAMHAKSDAPAASLIAADEANLRAGLAAASRADLLVRCPS